MKFSEEALDLPDYRTSVELKSDLQALLASRAWKVLEAQLHGHYHQLMAQLVAKPIPSLDAALAQEYSKGQVSTLLILRDLPHQLIAYCESAIADGPDEDDDA